MSCRHCSTAAASTEARTRSTFIHLSSAKNNEDASRIQEHLQQLFMTQRSQILEQNSALPRLSQ